MYSSDFCIGPTFVPVWRLYWSDVCTGLTFVLVRRLYCPTFVSLMFVPSDVCGSDFCIGPTFVPVWRMYWSDVCTGLTFVLVRCLYWSDVCTGPTFVLSDVCKSYVCTVRRLWARRLYWYRPSHWYHLNIPGEAGDSSNSVAAGEYAGHPIYSRIQKPTTITRGVQLFLIIS